MRHSMKIIFFVKQGMDSFLDNIIEGLSDQYETEKVVVTDYAQIDKGMGSSDICWFEWCDELISYGSKLPAALDKKIICRLHSYEAFTDYPSSVNWDTVDNIIFVAGHIRDYAIQKFKIDKNKTSVIPNGMDMDKFTFKKRSPGFDIAYVGYINYKKGPMLLLHTFKAIYDSNPEYRLHIAGAFQDERDVLYYNQMIKELNLQNNIIYEGWVQDIDKWLEDKSYILCTSILESQNMSVMQAMAKGIKPLIHNFVGAKNIYPQNCIFNTIPQAINMLSDKYDSAEYRSYIDKYYNFKDTINKIKIVIEQLQYTNKQPLVSIVMAVYNRESYIKKAIESVLNQSYKNIELIIVNDGSTDSSEEIIKSFNDYRIVYHYKNNTGQLDSLKTGLKMAKGKYITRVDSDDIIDKEHIKNCVNEMILDPGLRFIYTDFTLIDEYDNETGKICFRDYSNRYEIINDVFDGFSSVIPDVAFWSRDYIDNVILNYTEQNIPFYIDSILQSNYKHLNIPSYHYRQHNSNFASTAKNYKLVIEGKIKFIDFIIRRYFIQLDLNHDFEKNKELYYYNFTQKYLKLAELYNEAGWEIVKMFLDEAVYWFDKYSIASTSGSALIELKCQMKALSDKSNYTGSSYSHKNRRILIATTDDPNGGKAAGGKHVHIYNLQNSLNNLNIPNYMAAYIYNPDTKIDLIQLKNDFGLENYNFGDPKDDNFIYLVYMIQKQLEQKMENILSRSYISHINCHDVIAATAAHNALDALNIKIPVITTLHGYFTYENTDYGILNNKSPAYEFFMDYEKKAYRLSDRIIAVDSRIKEYAEAMLDESDASKVVVLKNSVDDSTFLPGMDDTDAFHNNIILVPRRLVPKNGVIYAVKAAHELINRNVVNFTMLIAGDGVEKPAIEEYVSENGLTDHIKVLGTVLHNQILQYYKSSKVVIIPSIPSNNVEEATSLSALEGMASGKVVIASNIGGLKEIIKNNYNGYLVNPGNIDELADALEMTINMDRDSYDYITMNAHAEIENEYGCMEHTRKYLNIFDGCSIN